MSNTTHPLDVEQFRSYGHKVIDFIADYYNTIEAFPVRSKSNPGDVGSALPASPPEDPEDLDLILEDIQKIVFPALTHWQSPSFFAYFPANSSTAGMLGEMLSSAFNTIGFSWISSPVSTEMETRVLDWLVEATALPSKFSHSQSGGVGGGVIQGTASEAVTVAMLAARDRTARQMAALHGWALSETSGKLVAYTSDQAHSCVQKACMIAGIENFRQLPTNESSHWSLSPAVLSTAIRADLDAGLIPFFLCATVGTTSSTAVDPVADLSAIAKEHSLWVHVDAAYAGSAMICPEFRHYFEGLEGVDSICLNAHKWLLTNFDCSCLWVKESKEVINALSLMPEYLRNKASEESSVVDYKDWQIPLGRRFRAIKLWMVFRLYGKSGLQNHIRKHVRLAEHFESYVRGDPRFEIIAPRTFALICFRMVPPKGDVDNGKSINSSLLESVNSEGQIFFTHTVLSGVYTLRFAIGATLTERRHVDHAWEVIQHHASEILLHWE